jgi:hypothetical protein
MMSGGDVIITPIVSVVNRSADSRAEDEGAWGNWFLSYARSARVSPTNGISKPYIGAPHCA